MRLVAILFSAVALHACSIAPIQNAPDSFPVEPAMDSGADSLFSSDAEVLSDDAIERILEFHWQPGTDSRIAILPFGAEYWFGWSEELTESAIAVQGRLTDRLTDSTVVQHASYLPSILAPSERSVARLREAAARYQADLLLVYRTQCHSFEKYRLLNKTRSRARCTVDALLLDTRTGLVPLSLAESRSFDSVKSIQDMNFRETMLRTQLEATAAALDGIAGRLVAFLDIQ